MAIPTHFHFIIVGAGGTGGYLASLLARQLKAIGKSYPITIIDGDVIEAQNIERQPYLPFEVGENKAVNLAGKISSIYSNVNAYPFYIDEPDTISRLLASTPVVLGCVDNNHARQVMEAFFDSRGTCIYIDSGNEKHGGEVCMAAKVNNEIYSYPKSHYFPDIFDGELVRKSDEGCSNKVSSGEQLLTTNVWAATTMLIMIMKMIVDEAFVTDIVFFDTASFSSFKAKSLYGEAM